MPELPEVETVVTWIKPRILHKRISSVQCENGYERVFFTHTEEELNQIVSDSQVSNVFRRGKYIVLELQKKNQPLFLCFHLRMTGRLLTTLSEEDLPRHLTATILFKSGTSLFFKDYRKFGRIYCFDNLDILEQKLGIEPINNPEFTIEWLEKNLRSKQKKIKVLLLDQSFLCGLGNIYVDEALHASGIHPETQASNIPAMRVAALHGAIISILEESIKHNGTTIINFEFGEKNQGRYVDLLKVYGRNGEKCQNCQMKTIKKIRVGQRGTYICPHCQQVNRVRKRKRET